ncbi:MAG TPA: acyl-CoA dehydrogenase family protein [Acidimicrobiales bacterium]|nr:acyl-CoA dehydrogenase family protein [Acidimicrobiales bacterium]
MEITFSEEREELRRSVRRFMEDKSPTSEVRRLMETDDGYNSDVWRQMANELGLQGLVIPERFGGSGYGYEELAIVFEEMGRSLLCAPFFSTVALATSALLASNDEGAMDKFLPGIASGTSIATLAFSEPSGAWDVEKVTTHATKSADGFLLNGTKSFVIDGVVADLLLVTAVSEIGLSLFAASSSAPGVTVTPLTTMDLTRKQSLIEFNDVPGELVGVEGGASNVVAKALQLASTALAAEQVGGAERVLELSVEYAKVRIQYGRPIGSYQAIKHKCSDMLVLVETAKSASLYATWAAATDSDELPVASSLAKAYCSEAYLKCAADNIQIHGGIGFTWEHDAHLFFKRAKSTEILLGLPSYHRELIARLVGM